MSRRLAAMCVLAAAAGCASGSPGQPSGAHTVGGAVTGLGIGKSIVLQMNAGGNLTVSANGNFTFAAALASGASYSVTVLTQPLGSACTISSGTGAMGAANITTVGVNCGVAIASAWAGTATLTSGALNVSAIVTWAFQRIVDNVAFYGPTGTATATVPNCALAPASGPLDATHDGILAVDYNVSPATYHGSGTTVWISTWTCSYPLAPPPFLAGVGAAFFGGSKGTLGVEAVGQVSPDGTVIQGTDVTTSVAPATITWAFVRVGIR